MRAEFLQKRLISAFFGFQWLNLAEILHLFKKYNNVGKVAVKRVSLTDYALWTLGSLDALVKKSSFPFHRSDYLCRESVDAAITHFFCRECCIYVLFCQECRDYALFDVEFYAEFLEEILRNTQNFGRNSAEKIGHWSLWWVPIFTVRNWLSQFLLSPGNPLYKSQFLRYKIELGLRAVYAHVHKTSHLRCWLPKCTDDDAG